MTNVGEVDVDVVDGQVLLGLVVLAAVGLKLLVIHVLAGRGVVFIAGLIVEVETLDGLDGELLEGLTELTTGRWVELLDGPTDELAVGLIDVVLLGGGRPLVGVDQVVVDGRGENGF